MYLDRGFLNSAQSTKDLAKAGSDSMGLGQVYLSSLVHWTMVNSKTLTVFLNVLIIQSQIALYGFWLHLSPC